MERKINIVLSVEEKSYEKKNFETVKNSDNSSCINPNLKSSKISSKKSKKGVDSLLEKLENGNKKNCHVDIIGLSVIANIEEKDCHSRKSMSPEYCKPRSPYCRDDDVVSPVFSNDDSNDTKQRRKRKLGKPLKLTKDLKCNIDEDKKTTNIKSNLPLKIDKGNYSINPYQSYSNDNSSIRETVKNDISRCKFNHVEKCIQMFSLKKEGGNSLINKFNEICNKHNKQNYIHTSRKTNTSRFRRRSECFLSKSRIRNEKKRRMSCSDIKKFNKLDMETVISQNNVTFNEVESQLEKMFAGLIESDKDIFKKNVQEEKPLNLFSVDEQKGNFIKEEIVKNSNLNNHSDVMKIDRNVKCDKNLKKKESSSKDKSNNFLNSRRQKKKQLENKQMLQKKSFLKKKNNKYDNLDETLPGNGFTNIVSSKYKGPIIQIKSSEKSLNCAQILNISRDDEEEKNKEKRKSNFNSISGRSKKINFQNNLEYRGKNYNAGLFNSTLSVKYDAHTADITWICVFCKKGPHFIIPGDSHTKKPGTGTYSASAGVLSDLFGPYLINNDYVDDIEFLNEREINKEKNNENNKKRGIKSSGILDQYSINVYKKKKKGSINDDSIYFETNVINTSNQKWEIWLHEQCIMWAAGVYIAGGRINGLKDAVWDAVKSLCDFCGLSGANIGCTKRGCKSVAHYCCALTAGWHFDSDQYIPKCNIHNIN